MRRVLHRQIQGLQIWKKQTKKRNKQSAISKFPKFHKTIPNFQAKVFQYTPYTPHLGSTLDVFPVHGMRFQVLGHSETFVSTEKMQPKDLKNV